MSEAAGREPSARVGNGCNRSPAPCGGLAWRQRHAIPARQGNPREPFDSCEKSCQYCQFLYSSMRTEQPREAGCPPYGRRVGDGAQDHCLKGCRCAAAWVDSLVADRETDRHQD